MNDYGKASFGLTQDQSLLHRLSETFYNGVDFIYERSIFLKKVAGIEYQIFSSFNCLNKNMPINSDKKDSLYLI